MTNREEAGFTLVELMTVVLIIGILLAVAIPVYQTIRQKVRQRACYANQHTIEGAVQTWAANHGTNPAPLAGVVNGSHSLVIEFVMQPVPRCPAAPPPADPNNPTVGEGAYTLDPNGELQACPWDGHGRFR